MTKKLGQRDAQEKDDITSKRQDKFSQLRGIRVQGELGNSTYHSIVYGHEQTKIFTFPYIEWAQEGLAEMLPLKNWDVEGALNSAEAAALEKIVSGFQDRLDRFLRVLRETVAINPNPDFPDDGIPLVTCKIAWVGGQQKLSVCKEVVPGLGTLPGISLGQEVWSLIHLPTGKFVLRPPSYEMACKAAEYVTSFMDFRPREAFVQFQGSNFPGILQKSLLYGTPFPQRPSGGNAYKSIYVPMQDPQLKKILSDVDALVEVADVKESLYRLVYRLQGQYLATRDMADSSHLSHPLHFTVAGPHGSGKSSVARLLARLLHRFEYLSTDQIVVASGQSFFGTTPALVSERARYFLDNARGGMLVIDDALSLFAGDRTKNNIAAAVQLIVQAMETTGNVSICLTGSLGELQNVMKLNPVLASLISHRFVLDNYDVDALTAMAVRKFRDLGFAVEDVSTHLREAIAASSRYGMNPGNGRFVDTLMRGILDHAFVRMGTSISSNSQEVPDPYQESDMAIVAGDIYRACGWSSDGAAVLGNVAVRTKASDNLSALVGLEVVKTDMQKWMSFVEVEQRRFQSGLRSAKPVLHAAFVGPAGTGKTTVARIWAHYLYGIGLAQTSAVTEVTRGDLVAEYLGQTAIKTQEVIRRAIGGVLFIDEAYALSYDRYGQEAITQLVYAMEEYRNELCVIFAGYDTEMKALFKANSGLLSRVPMHLRFSDYDADQLVAMAVAGMQNADLTLLPESEEAVRSTIRNAMRSGGGKLPGNGRWIRTFLEKVRLVQSHRIWLTQATDLCSIFPEDVKGGAEAMQDAQEASQRIGF